MFRAVPGVRVRLGMRAAICSCSRAAADVSIGGIRKIVRCLADVTVTPGTESGPGFTDSFRITFADKTGRLLPRRPSLAVMERYRRS